MIVNYDCQTFIVQATGGVKTNFPRTNALAYSLKVIPVPFSFSFCRNLEELSSSSSPGSTCCRASRSPPPRPLRRPPRRPRRLQPTL
jgi:hypothetical protein